MSTTPPIHPWPGFTWNIIKPGEKLREEMIEPITSALARLKNKTSRYICTGNDLAFVCKKIPVQILEQIDGHIWKPAAVQVMTKLLNKF